MINSVESQFVKKMGLRCYFLKKSWGSFQNRIILLVMISITRKHSEIGTILSLFSGAGGMDIGFFQAGFTPIWANDIDPWAVTTYNGVFPNNHCKEGDLLLQEIPKVKVDLIIGGPPCQGFSVAGKMDPTDPRSKHVWNFLRVVEHLRPQGFVMENVKALAVNSRWKGLLSHLRSEAYKLGYETKLFVLNASHFNVPQSRERMFLIGLKDYRIHNPIPITKENPPTLRSVLKKLPKYGEKGNDSMCTAKITLAKNPVLRKSPYAGMLFNGQGRPLNLDAPALTLPASMGGNRTPIIDQRQLETGENPWVVEYHQIVQSGGKATDIPPKFLRRITVEEAAAIQTFPMNMKFSGSQSAKYRQIGNAVPPNLAYHVALSVRKSFQEPT